MPIVDNLNYAEFINSAISLGSAFVLGLLIGAERQYRQRTAGLRTNVLVAVGSAAFVDVATRVGGTSDAMRVMANVITGVGFLGAGVIMKEGLNIRGLNTAATLWCSAAVGSCTGNDLLLEAILITFIVIAGNTLLVPVANAIDRIPLSVSHSEVSYQVRISAVPDKAPAVRKALLKILERAKYPVSEVETEASGSGQVTLIATLVSTSVRRDELDAVVAEAEVLAGVYNASWEMSAHD